MERIVAIDIGGTKIASALVELSASEQRILWKASIPTQASQGGVQVLERVIAQARTVLEHAEGQITGIGVSSAGVIDPLTGYVTSANDIMPGWGSTPLGPALQEACSLPCAVLNDVHAHALGEARRGAGAAYRSCLMAAVGTGVGGAFTEEGLVRLGAHGVAGHIGHVPASAAAGIRCACGASGHMESVAAGPAICEEYRRLASLQDPAPDGAEVDRLARAGDEAAISAQRRSGQAVGEVLAGMCSMLDPDIIILSGSVAQAGPAWHEAIASSFAAHAMPECAQTPIVSGSLGGDAPLIGAAEHLLRPAYSGLEGASAF